jgi:hypothetical protein
MCIPALKQDPLNTCQLSGYRMVPISQVSIAWPVIWCATCCSSIILRCTRCSNGVTLGCSGRDSWYLVTVLAIPTGCSCHNKQGLSAYKTAAALTCFGSHMLMIADLGKPITYAIPCAYLSIRKQIACTVWGTAGNGSGGQRRWCDVLVRIVSTKQLLLLLTRAGTCNGEW